MEHAETKQPRLKSFREIKRKAVDAGPASLVQTRTLRPDQPLPLFVEPAADGVDLADWAAANRDLLEQSVSKHGAVLFRGFGLKNSRDFEKCALAMCPTLFGSYGDLPHEELTEKVYHSTPYPADKHILFHNESSHLPSWPLRQFFMSVVVAQEGGETPILDCREVYKQLDPAVRDAFAKKGLMYVRNFAEGLDVRWQDFFKTDDRAAVESACRKEGMECEWTGANSLRIRQVTRAVAKHPRTGEMTFFNQVQLHHTACLDPATRQSLRALFKEEDMPRNVYYGDGTPIPDAVMDKLNDLYWKLAVVFPWQEGDMIMIDNMLVSHARNPFVGPRKIVVAMGEMVSGKDLAD